jgi:hypothetical protein
MGFKLDKFFDDRPYLFHLTARENLLGLKAKRRIDSTEQLLFSAGLESLLEQKREHALTVEVEGRSINIRDQIVLYENNIDFEGGWSFANLIRELNRRVFFWPGTADGPIETGQNHFRHYAHEQPVVLRTRTDELFRMNANCDPQFCKYNSGSPRCSDGRASPRGPNTFQMAGDPDRELIPTKVKEVTFIGHVRLPEFIVVGSSLGGPWTAL